MKKNISQNELSPGKVRAQLNLLDTAARQVISGMFGRGQAADRILSTYFRENRRCGSRDRAFISETVYSLLRYWGFMRKYLPGERLADLESGAVLLSSAELGALLSAASFVAGNFDQASVICDALRLPRLPKAANTPERRARQIAEYFHVEVRISSEQLIPDWIRAELPENLDTEKFISALSERPPMWVRLQTSDPAENDEVIDELRENGASVSLPEKPADALKVSAKVNLYTLETFRRGLFEIQDLASQCIGIICGAKAGQRWFDACAGAGGKTLQLAQLMKRKGSVTAGDLRTYKLEDLRRRARRAGFPNITIKENSQSMRRRKHPFDGVLVDAPCSCSGVWRRNPGAQWKLSPEEISELADQQLAILEEYSPLAADGGTLVYATCSIFDRENFDVVKRFMERHPEFKLDPFEHPITGAVMPGMARIDGADYDCVTLFAAKFLKVN